MASSQVAQRSLTGTQMFSALKNHLLEQDWQTPWAQMAQPMLLAWLLSTASHLPLTTE